MDEIHIGDVIKSRKDSKIGYVRWMSETENIVGIELPEPKGDCDGTDESGTRRFLCRFNHGVFISKHHLKKVHPEDLLYKIAELNEIIRAFGRFHPQRLNNVCKLYGIQMNTFWTEQSDTDSNVDDSTDDDVNNAGGSTLQPEVNGGSFLKSRSRPAEPHFKQRSNAPRMPQMNPALLSQEEREARRKQAAEIRESEQKLIAERRGHQRFNSDLARQGTEKAKQKYAKESENFKEFIAQKRASKKDKGKEISAEAFDYA